MTLPCVRPGQDQGVFYRSDCIWVSALHRFGEACVDRTRMPARQVARSTEPAAEYAHEFDLTVEQVIAVRAAWRNPRECGRIKRAETRAKDWAAGFYAGRKYEDKR